MSEGVERLKFEFGDVVEDCRRARHGVVVRDELDGDLKVVWLAEVESSVNPAVLILWARQGSNMSEAKTKAALKYAKLARAAAMKVGGVTQ